MRRWRHLVVAVAAVLTMGWYHHQLAAQLAAVEHHQAVQDAVIGAEVDARRDLQYAAEGVLSKMDTRLRLVEARGQLPREF